MSEFTNSKRKLYASLDSAKGRRECGLFMAQGDKCVADTLCHFSVESVLANAEWIGRNPDIVKNFDVTQVKNSDLQRISSLSSPPDVIAIYKVPQPSLPVVKGNIVLALDGVRDPGNLGTIIRIADWMGVSSVVASLDCVDVWNPKVVQASMGAISRVSVYYCDLCEFISENSSFPVFGTFLDGKDIYTSDLPSEGIVVMGNEGKGISADVAKLISDRLFIPPFPLGRPTSESLNVAVATAITLSEFRRQQTCRLRGF